MGKKQEVLRELYKICNEKGDFVFHNDLVKDVSKKIGFGSPFDATKLDNKSVLPQEFLQNDIALIHLGEGYHQFIQGVNKVYHDFEPVKNVVEWQYRKSILNQYDTSESNVLSVIVNQRILPYFLFGEDTEFSDADISNRPKTYFPHRTKTSFEYFIDGEPFRLKNIQIEIDLTLEFQGTVAVIEAKNGAPDNFSVYQIYHPFLYFYNANKDSTINGKIKKIYCAYVVREANVDGDILKIWLYIFANPLDITSISFVKSAAYKLVGKEQK